jgi:hypothetical protein
MNDINFINRQLLNYIVYIYTGLRKIRGKLIYSFTKLRERKNHCYFVLLVYTNLLKYVIFKICWIDFEGNIYIRQELSQQLRSYLALHLIVFVISSNQKDNIYNFIQKDQEKGKSMPVSILGAQKDKQTNCTLDPMSDCKFYIGSNKN